MHLFFYPSSLCALSSQNDREKEWKVSESMSKSKWRCNRSTGAHTHTQTARQTETVKPTKKILMVGTRIGNNRTHTQQQTLAKCDAMEQRDTRNELR